jgi:hypothetical protein
MSSKARKKRKEIKNDDPVESKMCDNSTQTNDNKDKEDKKIELDFEDVYNDDDLEYITKLKKKSSIMYHKYIETKYVIANRLISLHDIITSDITNEKRADLIEKYECLQNIIPFSQEYYEVRNQLRYLYNRYISNKIVSTDPDVEIFKRNISQMIMSTENRKIIEEKMEDFQYTEKDDKNKLKIWLNFATKLPLDRLSITNYDTIQKLDEIQTYLDQKLFGMKNVKERLLLFLNKKLRDSYTSSKGCNIALIGKPGVGKCLHPDTPIRMANLTIKLAKNIEINDHLMGDDSTFRQVTSTISGTDEMFRIHQQFGDSYTVNKSHILTLLRKRDHKVVDVVVTDVIDREYLYSPINGYYDGSNETKDAISYGLLYSGKVREVNNMPLHFPSLPPDYLEWTLDTKLDFYRYFSTNHIVYVMDIFPIDKIVDLLHSTGIRCKRYHRDIVFPHNEHFRIEPIGRGEYCGFTITGNERFLLADWTVTHNTAISKAISKCLGMPFSQISFGGINHPEFLLGHDYTYIGSKPGEISRCLSRMGTKNGILFFDEFDKASDKKDVMSTLLHITDFSQNNEFRDNYFPEITQDLSKIWFIYSMNELPKDPAMLDRLEVIEVDGYSICEKKIIAKEYLFPKFSSDLKIEQDFIIDEKALNKLVLNTGNEKTGVRGLERSINLLIEKVYFYLCNIGVDYQYEWFIKMKKSMKQGKLVINEDLIDTIEKNESFRSMYM